LEVSRFRIEEAILWFLMLPLQRVAFLFVWWIFEPLSYLPMPNTPRVWCIIPQNIEKWSFENMSLCKLSISSTIFRANRLRSHLHRESFINKMIHYQRVDITRVCMSGDDIRLLLALRSRSSRKRTLGMCCVRYDTCYNNCIICMLQSTTQYCSKQLFHGHNR